MAAQTAVELLQSGPLRTAARGRSSAFAPILHIEALHSEAGLVSLNQSLAVSILLAISGNTFVS